jgi:hypothetical protein
LSDAIGRGEGQVARIDRVETGLERGGQGADIEVGIAR